MIYENFKSNKLCQLLIYMIVFVHSNIYELSRIFLHDCSKDTNYGIPQKSWEGKTTLFCVIAAFNIIFLTQKIMNITEKYLLAQIFCTMIEKQLISCYSY